MRILILAIFIVISQIACSTLAPEKAPYLSFKTTIQKEWNEKDAVEIEKFIMEFYPVIFEYINKVDSHPGQLEVNFTTGDNIHVDGNEINIGDGWFKKYSSDRGAIIYNLTLISLPVESGQPAWVVSGLADYIRDWAGFTTTKAPVTIPQSYKSGFQKTAQFFKYLENNRPGFIQQFTLELSENRYSDSIFKKLYGESIDTSFAKYQQHVKEQFFTNRVPSFSISVESELPIDNYANTVTKQVCNWAYPRIMQILMHKDLLVAKNIEIVFVDNQSAPAVCHGKNRITLSADWFMKNPRDFGAIVHELTHTVQGYSKYNSENSWLIEGMTDLIRYHLGFRPKTHPKPIAGGNYKDGYMRTADFLSWLMKNYDKKIFSELHKDLVAGGDGLAVIPKITKKSFDQLWQEYQDSFRPAEKSIDATSK